MTNKEILLTWIDEHIPSNYNINPDNFYEYVGDPDNVFVSIHEWQIRKKLFSAYLEKPYEETIDNVLQDIKEDYVQNGYTNAERRAINKVLTRFNKPIL